MRISSIACGRTSGRISGRRRTLASLGNVTEVLGHLDSRVGSAQGAVRVRTVSDSRRGGRARQGKRATRNKSGTVASLDRAQNSGEFIPRPPRPDFPRGTHRESRWGGSAGALPYVTDCEVVASSCAPKVRRTEARAVASAFVGSSREKNFLGYFRPRQTSDHCRISDFRGRRDACAPRRSNDDSYGDAVYKGIHKTALFRSRPRVPRVGFGAVSDRRSPRRHTAALASSRRRQPLTSVPTMRSLRELARFASRAHAATPLRVSSR